jgi:glycosyltransferase involved in cell wall biosynthesis
VKFSLIIPVYNRPDEIDELLESLTHQTATNFDVWVIEDGSSLKCEEVCNKYKDKLELHYHFKANSGPGPSRNYGMDIASGDYFIIFDSDCLIPPQYIEEVNNFLENHYVDCFGGPDAAHASFSDVQKAINYSMTSFLTTGGIRGGGEKLGKFQPRSFNMGISRKCYETVGGYGKIHPGEDPDLSFRIWKAGFKTALIKNAHVYHKRRIDFQKFAKQVYKFGVVRVILNKWHPGTSKITYWFPTVFSLGLLAFLILGFWDQIFWYALVVYLSVMFIDAIFRTRNLKIAILAIFTSMVQFFGYGWGFLKSQFKLNLLRKEEKEAFPGFFFK